MAYPVGAQLIYGYPNMVGWPGEGWMNPAVHEQAATADGLTANRQRGQMRQNYRSLRLKGIRWEQKSPIMMWEASWHETYEFLLCWEYQQIYKELRTMKRTKAIICIEEYKSRRKHFLKPQDCDVYVLIQNKIMGFHKKFLKDSLFLTRQFEEENRKICLLNENISFLHFYKPVGCLYGLDCCFERSWEALYIYEILVQLQIKRLQLMMEADFKNSFEDYGFFVLFSMAQKFKIDWLKSMCKEELLIFGFEQLNFNKSDFLQCDRLTVEALIQIYRELLTIPKIMPKQKLKRMVSLWCKTNNEKIQVNYLLLTEIENIIKQTDSEENSPSQFIIKQLKQFEINYNSKVNCYLEHNKTLPHEHKLPKKMEQQEQDTLNLDENQLENTGLFSNIEQRKSAKARVDTESESLQQTQNQTLYSFEVSFSSVSNIAEGNFLDPKQINRENGKKQKKQHRRVHRSISPPASPWTPQFGEYITVKNPHKNQEGKAKRKKNLNRKETIE